MSGPYFRALKERLLVDVEMNQITFLSFDSIRHCLGTKNLNSCSVAVIVSEFGAILAHISPRAADASVDDFDAGSRHMRQRMDEVGRLYQSHINHFRSNKRCLIITAVYEDEVALPEQEEIMKSKLREWGLNPVNESYTVVNPPLEEAEGTVLIDARGKGLPRVYVENREVSAFVNENLQLTNSYAIESYGSYASGSASETSQQANLYTSEGYGYASGGTSQQAISHTNGGYGGYASRSAGGISQYAYNSVYEQTHDVERKEAFQEGGEIRFEEECEEEYEDEDEEPDTPFVKVKRRVVKHHFDKNTFFYGFEWRKTSDKQWRN